MTDEKSGAVGSKKIVQNLPDCSPATGDDLDRIAAVWGILREPGVSDTDLRAELREVVRR